MMLYNNTKKGLDMVQSLFYCLNVASKSVVKILMLRITFKP